MEITSYPQSEQPRNTTLHNDHDKHQLFVYILRVIFVIIFSIFTVCGNILCIKVVKHMPHLHGGTQIFMISLATSDLMVGFIGCLSVVPAFLGLWPYGKRLCRMSSNMCLIFCLNSVMSLCCLTIDRCISVTQPLRHVTLITTRRALAVSGVLWTLSCLTIILASQGIEVIYNKSAALCIAIFENDKYLIKVALLGVFLYFIPITVMICTYSRLLLISRQHSKQICALKPHDQENSGQSGTPNPCTEDSTKTVTKTNDSNPQTRGRSSLVILSNRCARLVREWKAVKMFCTVTIVFTIAWMPYVCTSLSTTITMRPLPGWAEFIVQWLALCNSWCNVCIYFLMNESFRKTAIRLVKNGQANACVCCYRSCLHVNHHRDNT